MTDTNSHLLRENGWLSGGTSTKSWLPSVFAPSTLQLAIYLYVQGRGQPEEGVPVEVQIVNATFTVKVSTVHAAQLIIEGLLKLLIAASSCPLQLVDVLVDTLRYRIRQAGLGMNISGSSALILHFSVCHI